MSSVDGPQVPLGAIAALAAVVAGAWWAERSRTAAQRTATPVDEVTLHRGALAAVEQARAQIHMARRYADTLRHYAVDFDVKAKLEPAFTEDLPPLPKGAAVGTAGEAATSGKDRQPMLFMVDGQERLAALKEAVEQYLPTSPVERPPGDDPTSSRTLLKQAIDQDGGIWTATRALAVLEEQGWRSDSDRPLNVVGNMLAVMARDGDIKRAGRGMYTSVRPPKPSDAEHEVAPGVFARQASPGVWVITGLVDGPTESPDTNGGTPDVSPTDTKE